MKIYLTIEGESPVIYILQVIFFNSTTIQNSNLYDHPQKGWEIGWGEDIINK